MIKLRIPVCLLHLTVMVNGAVECGAPIVRDPSPCLFLLQLYARPRRSVEYIAKNLCLYRHLSKCPFPCPSFCPCLLTPPCLDGNWARLLRRGGRDPATCRQRSLVTAVHSLF